MTDFHHAREDWRLHWTGLDLNGRALMTILFMSGNGGRMYNAHTFSYSSTRSKTRHVIVIVVVVACVLVVRMIGVVVVVVVANIQLR